MAQCKAKAKSTGNRCKRSVVPGREVCHYHGGKTPRGIASPHWKHGRYSKYLPTRLVEKYQEALSDRELLNLSDEIALLRTRQFELLERVDTKEARTHWISIDKHLSKLIRGLRAQNADQINDAVLSLQEAVRMARSDYAAWGEITDLAEKIRRLSETDTKRRKEMQLMVYAEDVTTFVIASATLAREFVPKNKLNEYSERLMGLLHRSGVPDNAGREP